MHVFGHRFDVRKLPPVGDIGEVLIWDVYDLSDGSEPFRKRVMTI